MSNVTPVVARKLIVKAGRLLSNCSFVAVTLGCYIILCLIMYLWLVIDLSQWLGYSAIIAYDLALGGSPLPYVHVLSDYPVLWRALKIFHGVAWLIVPVLAASMVDAAYRTYEQDQRRKELKLRRSIRAWVRNRLKSQQLTEAEVVDLTEEAEEFFDEWLANRKRFRQRKVKR